jgi:hypothetical protein
MPPPKPARSRSKIPRPGAGTRVTEEANGPFEPVGPVVQWRRVGVVLTDLAESTAGSDTAWPAFERLTAGLVEPLRILEELADLATPALSGDTHARGRFAARLRAAALAVGAAIDSNEPFGRAIPKPGQSDCCCGKSHPPPGPEPRRPVTYYDGTEVKPKAAVRPAQGSNGAAMSGNAAESPAAASGVFNETALTSLLAAAAAAAMDGATANLSVEEATGTIALLALDAGLLARLVRGHDEAGRDGLLAALESARSAGRLAWSVTGANFAGDGAVPPVMRTMSGGAPAGFDMPGFPSVPGVPGGFGLPGGFGFPGGPAFPDPLGERIAKLLRELLHPKVWDPGRFDHRYPFWREPVTYHDPYDLYDLRCFLEANRLLRALTEPPPAAPVLAVWNTGITSVTLTGPCGGATITVNGTGFGAVQPPDTALLLPTLDGCRAVTPKSWSNTRIEAVLPLRVSSGPVGFGDAAYIAAYDAWSGRMNAIEIQLSRLRCAPRPLRLVPPFGQCPPSSIVNEIVAGTPEIVGFTANHQTIHVLHPNQPLTLRWTVKNASSIRIDRTSAAGAPLSLVPAALQTSHAFGPLNHVSIGEWTYRITVTGACGGPLSRTVTVVTAKLPALSIAQVQVTQSIQTPDHAVKLVAFKPTVLRALVNHGLGTWGGGNVPGVSGRVRMFRAAAWSPWVDAANNTVPMQATPGTTITVPVLPSLNNTNDALNFILPSDWCWGAAVYQVEVRVAGFGATTSFAGYDDRVLRYSVHVNYENRRTLQFRYIRVNWNGMGPPTDADCIDTLRGAVPLLPTPSAGIAPVPGQGVHNRSASVAQTGAQRRDMLDDFEDEHNCSAFEAAFEWLGWDCPDDDGAIWVLIPGQFQGGEAHSIPGNVCFTPPSDGPYAAHEIGHCLNQAHVRLPATGANAPAGGDAASDWPNNGVLSDVPFDSQGTRTGTATNPRALSLNATGANGSGVGDVMTYWGTPNNTWPLPRRWQQLWDYIGP